MSPRDGLFLVLALLHSPHSSRNAHTQFRPSSANPAFRFFWFPPSSSPCNLKQLLSVISHCFCPWLAVHVNSFNCMTPILFHFIFIFDYKYLRIKALAHKWRHYFREDNFLNSQSVASLSLWIPQREVVLNWLRFSHCGPALCSLHASGGDL